MLTSIVAGLKGGSGKSLYAVALIDYFRARDLPVLVVETDTGNPDVADVYRKRQGERLRVERCALEDAYGWRELVAHLADHRGYAVVNMGGRNLPSIGLGVREGYYDQIATLGPYVTWWLMTSDAVTVEQLGSYLHVVPTHPVHVVANAGADQRDTFPFVVERPPAPYVDQLLRSDLERIRTVGSKVRRGGGGELYVPRLASAVAIKMRNEDLDLRGVQEVVDGDDREAAREWTEVVHARIAGVLDDTPSATAPRAEHETATSVVVAREPGPESAPGEREEAPAVRRPSVMERLCPEDRELVVAAAKAASAGAGPVVTVGQTLEPDTERRWVPWAEKLFRVLDQLPDVVVRCVVTGLRSRVHEPPLNMALVVRDDRRFLREVETVRSFSYNYRLDQVDISSPPPLSDREIFWALVSDRRTLPSHSQLLRELPRAIDELERWERAGDEP